MVPIFFVILIMQNICTYAGQPLKATKTSVYFLTVSCYAPENCFTTVQILHPQKSHVGTFTNCPLKWHLGLIFLYWRMSIQCITICNTIWCNLMQPKHKYQHKWLQFPNLMWGHKKCNLAWQSDTFNISYSFLVYLGWDSYFWLVFYQFGNKIQGLHVQK